MKILIFGARGQLGGDLIETFKDEDVLGLDYEEADISNLEGVSGCFDKYHPDFVINAAAMTDVPGCEKDDIKAFTVNALGAKFIAYNCVRRGAGLIHISTDYVFDGNKGSPYEEDDTPSPSNVYGLTKLCGEYYVRAAMEKFFIVRTSGLYGLHKCRGKGGNFIDTMLRLSKEKKEIKVVSDEILTPTYTKDLAEQIKELMKTPSYGVFHATSEGYCSWYEFAEAIFNFLGIEVNLIKVTQKEFGSAVRRPHYSVLENKRLKSLGLNRMRDWKVSLECYLRERQKGEG